MHKGKANVCFNQTHIFELTELSEKCRKFILFCSQRERMSALGIEGITRRVSNTKPFIILCPAIFKPFERFLTLHLFHLISKTSIYQSHFSTNRSEIYSTQFAVNFFINMLYFLCLFLHKTKIFISPHILRKLNNDTHACHKHITLK